MRGREEGGGTICNKEEIYLQSTCSAFHIYFCFLIIFLSSLSNSEDFSSEDERLGSASLGAKVTGQVSKRKNWKFCCFSF